MRDVPKVAAGGLGRGRPMLHLKTSPPSHRPELVLRRELIGWIESSSAPIVSIVAPAGYGKTTLLSQFFESSDRSIAWLGLDDGDGDPKTLLTGLTHTLEEAGMLRPSSSPSRIESGAVLTRGIGRLLDGIDVDAKGILILDHIEQVTSQAAIDVLGALLTSARDRLQVIFASRSHSGLPFGVLRAHGDLLELGAEDLALSEAETAEILALTGVVRDRADLVHQKTEGWPVAVYLTARAMRELDEGSQHDVRGDDAYLADYLRAELLGSVSAEVESFLIRSSVLPRLSGELCDYVLETTGSAETLVGIHNSSSLLIPLDRSHTWFRYHSLLREFLASELRSSRGGDMERRLNRRASRWFEANGSAELSLEHSSRAGDYDRLAVLVARAARSMYSTGHSETLSTWLDVLERSGVLKKYPDLAALGSLTQSLSGDSAAAERLSRIAYDDPAGLTRSDTDLKPLARMVRAYQAPRGVEVALVDARGAHETLKDDNQWAHAAASAVALTTLAVEGHEAAEPFWVEAVWRGDSPEALPLTGVANAMLAVAAIDAGDWESAEGRMGNTALQIGGHGLETYMTSCLPFIVAARLAAHRGELDESHYLVGAASATRTLLSPELPVYSVFTLQQAARAYMELADIAGARRVLRDADDILAVRPRLGRMVADQAALRAQLATLPTGNVGPSSLTHAELRLLPLLVTHLKFPEIAERLFVSRHTVKSQAMSIYRKLGAGSRSEAVEKARAIGLIST